VTSAPAELVRLDPSPPMARRLAAAVLAAVGAAVVAGYVATEVSTKGAHQAGKPVAAVLGLALVVLAVVRFEAFVLALLVVRPSMDALGGQTGALNPASVLGVLFIAAALLWLARRWQLGEWVRPGAGTRTLYAFTIAAGASVLVSVDRHASVVALGRVLSGVLMFGVLEQLLAGRPDRLRRLLGCGVLGSVAPLAVGFYQLAHPGSSGYAAGDLSRVHGTFVHPNTFATYLVMLLLAALAVASRVGWRGALLALLYCAPVGALLISTYARGAFLGLLLGVAYVLWRRQPFLVLLGVALAVGVVLAVPSINHRFADLHGGTALTKNTVDPNSLDFRLHYWPRVVRLAAGNHVSGIGLETVVQISPERLQPHNVWVQAYAETGVIGAVALAGVAVGMTVTLTRRRRRARTPLAAGVATGAIGIGLSLLSQSLSENILTETVIYWAAASLMAWGYTDRAPR